MSDIHITLVQYNIVWEDKISNLTKLDGLLEQISTPTDLIVLPEMFQTGFSMHPSAFAEDMSGPTVQWMKQKAQHYHSAICGSMMCADGGKYYNRCLVVFPDGDITYYDKRHLFGMGDESEYFTSGKERITFQIGDFSICPMVCYDLRFPVWSRNTVNYDILIYAANWPNRRNFAWKQLLIARAIENQSYVIGVNRVGLDGLNRNHTGDTAAINPDGSYIWLAEPQTEQIKTVSLNKESLLQLRKDLPFLKDADKFEIL